MLIYNAIKGYALPCCIGWTDDRYQAGRWSEADGLAEIARHPGVELELQPDPLEALRRAAEEGERLKRGPEMRPVSELTEQHVRAWQWWCVGIDDDWRTYHITVETLEVLWLERDGYMLYPCRDGRPWEWLDWKEVEVGS